VPISTSSTEPDPDAEIVDVKPILPVASVVYTVVCEWLGVPISTSSTEPDPEAEIREVNPELPAGTVV
jgi:hypothetical protein